MNQTTEPLTLTVPLSFEAHSLAQQYRQQQISPQKAKQVYLNTLAVYAVDFYLRCLGWETDRDNSDSHNPIALQFMDVADLAVKQLGKLECRPVLPDARVCQVPPEAWSERIGYLAVALSPSLKQATILGFTPTAAAEIPLARLRSLAEFPEYLNKIRQKEMVAVARPRLSISKTAANLSKWFEGVFEAGWQAEQANRSLVGVRNLNQALKEVRRVKLLDLGMELGERAVALAIVLTKNKDEKVSVLVRVRPTAEIYLPANLKLALLAESGEILQQVSSRSQDNYIQLKSFKGQTGDRFRIEVSLDRIGVAEDFLF
jgi:hypothetical protein